MCVCVLALGQAFETKLDKKRKNRLGAPSGKTMCFFIDDLNMPALVRDVHASLVSLCVYMHRVVCVQDKFGSQPPIELLRQVIDQGGFYDRHKLFFKYVANCAFVAACAPPGGGRYVPVPPIHPRFLCMTVFLYVCVCGCISTVTR